MPRLFLEACMCHPQQVIVLSKNPEAMSRCAPGGSQIILTLISEIFLSIDGGTFFCSFVNCAFPNSALSFIYTLSNRPRNG